MCLFTFPLMLVCLFTSTLAVPGHTVPSHPELYQDVKKLIQGHGSADDLKQRIDEKLLEAMPRCKTDEVGELLALRRAAELFKGLDAEGRKTALLLFQRLDWCRRFFHNVDPKDDLPSALKVLQTLHDHAPEAFPEMFELCLAYSLVWDNFVGHTWASPCLKVEADTMLKTYRFYLDHMNRMLVKPGTLPCELNIYVVGTCLTSAEREWVLKNYRAKKLQAPMIYNSVPWTLREKKTLSPGNGKGLHIPYTLQNIKEIGGACMEQAYFTENIFRLFGVPATYTSGGGHSWTAVLNTRSRNALDWDYDVGRFSTMEGTFRGVRVVNTKIYYKAHIIDPTDSFNNMNDYEVSITGSFWKEAGSIDRIEESYIYLDAAQWLDRMLTEDSSSLQLGDSIDGGTLRQDLIKKSIETARFNGKTWEFLRKLSLENRMLPEDAIYWAEQAKQHTLDQYPGFTIHILDDLIPTIQDPRKIRSLFKKIYRTLIKDRHYLICDMKHVEGKFLLQQKELREGIDCFLYPLMHNEMDKQALRAAQERIRSIPSLLQDTMDIIKAYEQIFGIVREMKPKTREAWEIQKYCLEKLIELCTKVGDSKKVRKYKKLSTM